MTISSSLHSASCCFSGGAEHSVLAAFVFSLSFRRGVGHRHIRASCRLASRTTAMFGRRLRPVRAPRLSPQLRPRHRCPSLCSGFSIEWRLLARMAPTHSCLPLSLSVLPSEPVMPLWREITTRQRGQQPTRSALHEASPPSRAVFFLLHSFLRGSGSNSVLNVYPKTSLHKGKPRGASHRCLAHPLAANLLLLTTPPLRNSMSFPCSRSPPQCRHGDRAAGNASHPFNNSGTRLPHRPAAKMP